MKKTMKRGIVKTMYEALVSLPIGHLASEDLEIVMGNIVALSAPYEHYQKLMQELGKRLYEGADEEKIQKFNSMLLLAGNAETIEKRIAIHNVLKAEYAELYELFQKQNKVENSILNKDVEVELNEVDRAAFVKAIMKAKPNVAMVEFDLFEPMFKAEEKKEVSEDYSELDELLAE